MLAEFNIDAPNSISIKQFYFMSQNLTEAFHILQVSINQLRALRYKTLTRNCIRKVLNLKHNAKLQSDELRFRNECFAFHSFMQQELHSQDLEIQTPKQLHYAMKHNRWVK